MLDVFTTTHVTVDGTAGIGTDTVTLMTCIPDLGLTARKGMQCIVQTHGYDDTAESYSSSIKTYFWDFFTDFPE